MITEVKQTTTSSTSAELIGTTNTNQIVYVKYEDGWLLLRSVNSYSGDTIPEFTRSTIDYEDKIRLPISGPVPQIKQIYETWDCLLAETGTVALEHDETI